MLSRFSPLRLVPRFLSWCVLKTLPFPVLAQTNASTTASFPPSISHNNSETVQRVTAAMVLIASVFRPGIGMGLGEGGNSSKSVRRAAWFFGVLTVAVWVAFYATGTGTYWFTVWLDHVIPQQVWDTIDAIIWPSKLPDRVAAENFLWGGLGRWLLAFIDLSICFAVSLWFFRLFVAHCLRAHEGAVGTGGTGPIGHNKVQRVWWRTTLRWARRLCWFALVGYAVWLGVAVLVSGPILWLLGIILSLSNRLPMQYPTIEDLVEGQYIWCNFAVWALTLTCFATLLVFWFRERLAHRITALDLHRHCAGCGYALTGITTNADNQGVCPECGVPFVRNA